MQVLVVEDNPDTAVSQATILRLTGHTVDIASDGPAALVAAEARPPDVVLLDIGLPMMDGWEVAKRLRKMSLPIRPTIIAVTGYGREDERRRSYEAGIDFHLVKPVDVQELQDLLTELQGKIQPRGV